MLCNTLWSDRCRLITKTFLTLFAYFYVGIDPNFPQNVPFFFFFALEVRNTSEKSEKIRAKSKKLDEDAMLCNTLWSDRCRLITKTFLTFLRTSTSELIQTFHKTFLFFFFFFALIREKFRFPAKII